MKKLAIPSIPMEATVHTVKVALFIVISAGLVELLNNLGKLNLDPFVAMIVAGVINIILAWLKKYRDVREERKR
jgi:hypothetical protein